MTMSLVTKSGKALNPIGIGTWNVNSRINADNLSSEYRGVEPVHGSEEQSIEAIRYSISKGQNHLDCAQLYGGFYTDEVVGQALVGLPREDLFVADKLWKISVAKGKTRPTVEKMLEKLGTDYIDLLYIHSPFTDAPWQEAIPQIDELIDAGIVRQFGVSNFTLDDMKQAQALARHPIAANQMNYNLLHREEVSEAFRDFCAEHTIQIVAYQPIKRQEVLNNKTVQEIAKAHKATPSQVALAWLIKMDTLPIPKALQKSHIDENLGALQLELTPEDMDRLSNL
jgi:diketogulonate reductase-like aldo/keto reductase